MAPRTTLIALLVLAAAALPPPALAAAPPAAAPPASAAPGDGYVRLAHLSPDTPAVDVYLYSAGRERPRLVLRHVGYGVLSPYQKLAAGRYEVAMRPADAPAASRPKLSAAVRVRPGAAYTVAGFGPFKGLKLRVLDDAASVPPGRAGVRVIAASLKESTVDVTAGSRRLARRLPFCGTTGYRPLRPGPVTMRLTGRSGARAARRVDLGRGAAGTLVVLDGRAGPRLIYLKDTAAPGAVPHGGVETGRGGLTGVRTSDVSMAAAARLPRGPAAAAALLVLTVAAALATVGRRLRRP